MPQPTTPTRAIGYVRVSTDQQADHGVSLEAQQAKLTAYAALYDLDLVTIIVDAGASAKTWSALACSRLSACSSTARPMPYW